MVYEHLDDDDLDVGGLDSEEVNIVKVAASLVLVTVFAGLLLFVFGIIKALKGS
jgi:hypothetical protein